LMEAWQSVSLDLVPPLFQSSVRSKEAIWFQTYHDMIGSSLSDDLDQQSLSWSVIPLTIGEIVKGILVLGFPQQDTISDDTRRFVLALAEQCAQALARAHLYEAEAKARHEAELANQVKLKFLGMISHELRTPLTSIKGFISTMLADDVVWPLEQQREFLAIANEESDKLTELVDQLLDVSRIQAGSIQIAPKVCRFTEILEIAAAQFEILTRQHSFAIHIAPNLPLILADHQRIAQVLVNLVGNATKYSPAGTSIDLYADMEGDYLHVEIADHGMGIPEEDREIIFEAFRQVERKDGRRHQQGAGLGLAICKGLIEAHQGRIWVNPLYTEGTSICFTIPCA
jgi:K+-sensing histidine kinase KdpD